MTTTTTTTNEPNATPSDGSNALRTQLHQMWSAVASGWAEHADFADARGAAVTEGMLELAALQPGARVLELACGPGGLGLAAAQRIGPDGEVVISDVVAEMTAIAAARASALGLGNVSTRELDIESLDEVDACYDVVLCREGIMLVQDPVLAAGEIRRVLRPGGRVVLSVWGPRQRNPWLGVLLDSVSAQLGAPVPPPGVPGPFSLDDPDRLEKILSEAGLIDIEVGELPTPYHADSFDEWWTRTVALAGPVAQMLGALPEPATRALRDRAREGISVYQTPAGLEIPGVSLIATATRAYRSA
jgi:ubiquinone/menaquinone biosynthesis C-methylase UbiE